MPRAGSHRRRKARTQKPATGEDSGSSDAMTMVFKYGEVSPNLTQLVRDLRCVLAPHTYSHLRESKRTKLRDYVKAGKELGTSSLLAVTKSGSSSFLKFGRLSDGPTSIFRLSEFCLAHDVRVASKRPRGLSDRDLLTPPALILHGFEEGSEISTILKAQFEQLVPSLDVATANPKLIRRVLLISLEEVAGSNRHVVRIRHFAVSIRNTSVSRAVDKLLKSRTPSKKIAKLADAADILDAVSESELENETMEISGGNFRLHSIPKTASLGVKLVELGPRIDMDLVNIQDGVFDGVSVYAAPVSSAATALAGQAAVEELQKELRAMQTQETEQTLRTKRTKKADLKSAVVSKKLKQFEKKEAVLNKFQRSAAGNSRKQRPGTPAGKRL